MRSVHVFAKIKVVAHLVNVTGSGANCEGEVKFSLLSTVLGPDGQISMVGVIHLHLWNSISDCETVAYPYPILTMFC